MEKIKVAEIIEVLESMRNRKSMYLRTIDTAAAENYRNGFHLACWILGYDIIRTERNYYEKVVTGRGWDYRAAEGLPLDEMKKSGLSDEQIVDEILAIEIDVWKSVYESM